MISHDQVKAEITANDPPIKVNQHWATYDADGFTMRKLRILALHPDGGFIFVDLPSKLIRRDYYISVCSEYNLRRVFRPVIL